MVLSKCGLCALLTGSSPPIEQCTPDASRRSTLAHSELRKSSNIWKPDGGPQSYRPTLCAASHSSTAKKRRIVLVGHQLRIQYTPLVLAAWTVHHETTFPAPEAIVERFNRSVGVSSGLASANTSIPRRCSSQQLSEYILTL